MEPIDKNSVNIHKKPQGIFLQKNEMRHRISKRIEKTMKIKKRRREKRDRERRKEEYINKPN
jgi:hypothetical protein